MRKMSICYSACVPFLFQTQDPIFMAVSLLPPSTHPASHPQFPNIMNKDRSSLLTQECQIWNHNQASISSAQHAPHFSPHVCWKIDSGGIKFVL